MTIQGTCFGYGVTSARRLRYLRGGTGTPLEVRDGSRDRSAWPVIREWRRPHAPFDGRLHAQGVAQFAILIEGAGWYEVDTAAPRILVPPGDDVRVEERTWGLPVLLCFLAHGDLALHAAALRFGSRAVLVGAPGRHGKSTLATAFAARGGDVLAEDLCRVSVSTAGVQLVPGPAMLRPRRDVADLVSGPELVEYARDRDRVHLGLPHPRRGTSDPVAVEAVVLLREGPAVGATPCSSPRAVRDLWNLAFNLSSAPDRRRCFDQVASVVSTVPVWDLWRPLHIEGLDETLARLAEIADGATAGPRRQSSSHSPDATYVR